MVVAENPGGIGRSMRLTITERWRRATYFCAGGGAGNSTLFLAGKPRRSLLDWRVAQGDEGVKRFGKRNLIQDDCLISAP